MHTSALQKEKPTSGGNHLAGLNTQNTDNSLSVLAALERISIALEKNNEIALMQKAAIDDISTVLIHLKDA